MKTLTNSVLMIRPANFGYNPQTAVNNAFQTEADENDQTRIAEQAQAEFDDMVKSMRAVGIDVHVWQDSADPIKPDAIFPNNWFSTTPDGSLLTYPMFAPNRRIERDPAIIDFIEHDFDVVRRYEFEHFEAKDLFLEGTGSILYDHDEKVAYACLSPRTDIRLLDKLAVLLGYKIVSFTSVDERNVPIYHTNVMMALGEEYAIVCLDSIPSEEEKEKLIAAIEAGNRTVFPISYAQVNAYAGNMIQLRNKEGEPVLVMSAQARKSLTKNQVKTLESSSILLSPDIQTIEEYGGGSARCMIAEIFLDKRHAIV